MKFKKILLGLSTLTLASAPTVAVISCSKINKKFDIGYAMSDLTSLNYIKYESVSSFAHSIVESFGKSAPNYDSKLASYMKKIPKIYFKDRSISNVGGLYEYSYTSGVLKDNDKNFPSFESHTSNNDTFIIRLNGKSKWSNGDILSPSNFIDAFVYVVNLNTGSQLLDKFIKLKIKNADKFVLNQMVYSKKYKKLYKNPFGYIKNKYYDSKDKNSVYWVQRNDSFPLQIYNQTSKVISKMKSKDKIEYLKNQKKEKELVSKIEYFAKNLGIYADLNSSHPYNHVEGINPTQLKNNNLSTNKYKFLDNVSYNHKDGEKIYPNIFQIKTSIHQDAFSYFVNTLLISHWLPINRKFVESIGGIEKFGLDSSRFLIQGPFNISNIVLGTGGSITLEKNIKYWDYKNTIPNKIKLFFQTDQTILSSLFEDGYIAITNLNAIITQKLYSNMEYRELLTKNSGYGSTGIVFNLDKKSSGYNSILGDRNLRKALFYSIDRDEIIKLSGYDSTLPIYSLIDGSYDARTKWRGSERGGTSMLQKIGDSVYYDKYQPNIPKKLFPYKINAYKSKNTIFGNFDRKDLFQNEELAKKYFNDFLKKHPGKHTIEYMYDSTKQLLQIGIAIQSSVKKMFGDEQLKIEIKGYPKSIYNSYYTAGEFQLTYKNLDYLEHRDSSGGTSDLYLMDGIIKDDSKNMGFIKNPTGGWTFKDVVKNHSNALTSEEKEIKSRLNISDVIWNKIKELCSIPTDWVGAPIEKNLFLENRKNAFFNNSEFIYNGKTYEVDKNFLTPKMIVDLSEVANKLILEASPIIPLFIVDNTFQVSRIINYKSKLSLMFCFDYGYDYKNKPIDSLPGKEALVDG